MHESSCLKLVGWAKEVWYKLWVSTETNGFVMYICVFKDSKGVMHASKPSKEYFSQNFFYSCSRYKF